ncbi:MAG: heme-binding domain-containing protein [Herpetosiphonaceae bacterium]|nr:heme-binding domain-containing protein [Herpetosiphonaceae bacterium]
MVLTIGGLALSQLVPISHTNPPVQTSIAWDSPQTASLAKRACMDCHSNTTTYPWYSYIAPSSWLLASHISSGRDKVNLSTLNTLQSSEKQRLPNDMAREIRNGSMPPSDYLIMHPEARLSVAEKQQLIQGLQKSLSQ